MALSEPKTISAKPATIDQRQAALAWTAINAAHRIGIISHRHPDPDTIGSNMALRKVLTKLGKQVDSLCIHQPPKNCHLLIQDQNYLDHFDPSPYDLIISVDCGSLDQIAFEISATFPQGFLNIDHHPSNNNFGSLNIVHPELSSTSEIIYLLLQFWNQPIDQFIATCLLFGLYYDTGSFMHSNVNSGVLEIASDLISKGARLDQVIENLYHNFDLGKYHLWGNILEEIKVTDQQTAVAVITNDTFANSQTGEEDVSGLIDYVSMVKDSHFAVVISQENGSNSLKGSLRTRQNDLNLSTLAQTMGGGGHRKASGFGFAGKIEKQTLWKIT